MNKKAYMAPEVTISNIKVQPLLTDSTSIWSDMGSGTGIGYGGVDTGGTKDPSSRFTNKLWDDDDNDDLLGF